MVNLPTYLPAERLPGLVVRESVLASEDALSPASSAAACRLAKMRVTPKARVILCIRILSVTPDGSANRRLDRTPRLPLTRVVNGHCSPKTTTLCSACGSCLLPGASTATDSGGAELKA